MFVTSVNIGQERTIERGAKSGVTGIYKEPVSGPAVITRHGLPGDAVVDTTNHGGPDQAVYIYGGEDYEWWAGELGHDLAPGTYGENLTVSGLASAPCSIGDLLLVGPVILQVTAPRIPCSILAARMGDPAFVKRFRAAERPGLYCRVLAPGPVQAGDVVRIEPFAGETITILEMFRDFYDQDPDEASIRRHLAAPIAIRDRIEQEERLRKLLASRAGR